MQREQASLQGDLGKFGIKRAERGNVWGKTTSCIHWDSSENGSASGKLRNLKNPTDFHPCLA